VGEVELKQFPVYRLARTDSGRRSGGAFWKLFMHIESNDISMTAPVEMTYADDGERLREDRMAFLYGSTELGELGADGAVEVLDTDPGWAVSLGCRGNTTRSAIESARGELEAWLATRPDLIVSGELRVMGYNSPMVRSSKRYFEVQLPVTQTSPATTPEPRAMFPLVIDFSKPDAARAWSPIDDSVMGGRSASRIQTTADGTAVFSGLLSLENNGGFCSVRTAPADWDVADAEALVLRFRGDGLRYKLRLRTDDRWDGVSYEQAFETEAGAWTELAFPISDFRPVWRGRLVRDAPALDPARIRTFGLMLSDKQTGEFRLEVESLAKRTVTP
jgi:NADH dehydrogenase [ubiquinone] 1 alpha subcomplex assembly factor 1